MDIRHSGHSSYPAVIPAEGALRVSSSRRSLRLPSPPASGEIIDCVEIQSADVHSTARRQAPYPIRIDPSLQTKGRWIDIWI
jgi:hypothetical protein